MVFRKPYAFLIKNFKKIHIVLLVLCAFIYYKVMTLSSFVNDFINYLSYDPFYEPITKYTNIFVYIVVILAIAICCALVILLKRKHKPWKLYLIPILSYGVLLFTLISVHSFFNSYSGDLSTTTIRILSNLLFLTTIPQYFIFLILIIRVTGLDLKNFNFSADEEFLELSQEDKEEFEVSLEFDKYAYLRLFKKTKRSLIYFYQEHRYFCNIFLVIFTIFVVGSIYRYFGVEHKVIKEGQTNIINDYQITVNKSYYTDKDKTGNVIEKGNSFVVVNITIVNNGAVREFSTSDFRLVNGRSGFASTGDTYSNNFSDLGKSSPKNKLQRGEKKTFNIIFKVDNKKNPKRFVLYYQQYKRMGVSYLRKIKLNLNDASDVLQNNTKKLGDSLTIVYPNKDEKEFTFLNVEFRDAVNYNIESCNKDRCDIVEKNYNTTVNNKILEINFSSGDYEGEDLIDFSIKYGKIIYKDNDDITREIRIENAIGTKKYLGKYLYIKVPQSLENAKEINFTYVIRNQKYIYKIR